MASVNHITHILEGFIGTLNVTGDPPQAVATWVESCKAIMRQSGLRDLTDWQFYVADGVVQTGSALDATTGTLYAALVRQDSADAERDFVAFFDAGATTLDGTAALDNTVILVLQPPATATDNTSEWHGISLPNGLPYSATGLSVSADGRDGANPAATDLTVYVLVRT